MKKLNSEEVLLLSILTLSVAFLWIFLGVRRAATKTEKPVVTASEIAPFNADWDMEVISELEKRN